MRRERYLSMESNQGLRATVELALPVHPHSQAASVADATSWQAGKRYARGPYYSKAGCGLPARSRNARAYRKVVWNRNTKPEHKWFRVVNIAGERVAPYNV